MSTSTITKYASVFNIGLQNTFVYRWNYFLRALFGLIPLAGTVFLWARRVQGARRRTARLRLRLDDLLLFAHDSGQQPGRPDRGRMANRRRHSRRPDQCAAHQADELSRVPVQHFFEWPSCLQLRHSAADRGDLHLFPRVHRAAERSAGVRVNSDLDRDGGVHSILSSPTAWR